MIYIDPDGHFAFPALVILGAIGAYIYDAIVTTDPANAPGPNDKTYDRHSELEHLGSNIAGASIVIFGLNPPIPGKDSGLESKPSENEASKRGPKTDPNAPHNKTIREEADKIETEGGTIIAGGGREKERLIPTPGGKKSGRRPDILYEDDKATLKGRNIGKTNADGTPIPREQDALDDLNNKGGLPTDYKKYD